MVVHKLMYFLRDFLYDDFWGDMLFNMAKSDDLELRHLALIYCNGDEEILNEVRKKEMKYSHKRQIATETEE